MSEGNPFHRYPDCCRTSNLINCLSKCLCIRPNEKSYSNAGGGNGESTLKPTAPKFKEPSIIQFIEEQKAKKEELLRRRSKFICDDFRNQLIRIPLKHREKEGNGSNSFVL